jgi:16S rRNA (cytosine967-C5)-methyltransferase
MTPAARLSAAMEVLAEIEARHRPVGEALRDWGNAHRFAGSKDRAAIGNLVYDALRWRASSAWVMGSDTPRALVLGTVGHRWGLGADGLAAYAGDPHGPEPLTDDERVRLAHADLAAAPPQVRADLPDWLAPHFQRLFGEDWVAEGEALAKRPPLDMRANRLKADRDKVIRALGRQSPAATPYAPDGIRIAPTEGEGRHPNVQAEPPFQKGWFEVQDEGSQVAALMTAAKPGEQVLDLCAGAGGKTLALAAMMANKGQVFATDRDRIRLAPIFERIKRAGARNIQVREAGASLDALEGHMDAVLVDAPCTGTGVWRRRPDAKWRLTDRALADRIDEQRAVLAEAARYVKPGGRLVYVTCSLLPEEDGDQVEAFAAAHPEFTPLPGADIVAAAAATPSTGLADPAPLSAAALLLPTGLVLSPHRTGTDGFFVAVLRKR